MVISPPSSTCYCNVRLGIWTLGDANTMRLRKSARDIVAKSSNTSVSSVASVNGVLAARGYLNSVIHHFSFLILLLSLSSTFHTYFCPCNAHSSGGTVSPIPISGFVVHFADRLSSRHAGGKSGSQVCHIFLFLRID